MELKHVAVSMCLLIGACTERNPAFCGDGICVDPDRPYCDIDGSFAGTAGECIAVACTPMEFAACRGDLAITCNSTGTNFDETACPLGCDSDASGCRECIDNSQCVDETQPICNTTTSACTGCVVDDDCESRVCDVAAGSCVPETSIVYATADNVTGSCSRAQPCPLSQAVIVATNTLVAPTIRMLPGTYVSPLEVRAPTASPLQVVATGATIAVVGDTAAVVVSEGANVAVRNLQTSSERAATCGEPNAIRSSLSITHSSLTAVGTAGTQLEVQRCDLRLGEVGVELGEQTLVAVLDDGGLIADKLHVRSTLIPVLIFAGVRLNIEITNSVIENLNFFLAINDAGPPGTHIKFAYDTLLLSQKLRICDGAPHEFVTVAFENSILHPNDAGDPALNNPTPGNCTFVNTLLTRQSAPPAGTIVGDPAFAAPATHDYHLTARSSAVDAAGGGSVEATSDLDNVSRPQGTAPDIGAYELPQ